jgi:hypothetical protein
MCESFSLFLCVYASISVDVYSVSECVCLLCDSTVEAARLAQRGHGFWVSDPLGCVHSGQILRSGRGVL